MLAGTRSSQEGGMRWCVEVEMEMEVEMELEGCIRSDVYIWGWKFPVTMAAAKPLVNRAILPPPPTKISSTRQITGVDRHNRRITWIYYIIFPVHSKAKDTFSGPLFNSSLLQRLLRLLLQNYL